MWGGFIMNHKLKDILVKTVFRAASAVNKIVPKDQHKILLYENNVGFQDNVRSIYDYMIKNNFNKQYKILISANKFIPQTVPANVRTMSNFGGVLNFFTTGHVFYCHGKIPMYPSKNQKVVQMWHGTPFKGNNARQNRSTTAKPYYTNILSSSPYFEKIIVTCGRSTGRCSGERTGCTYASTKRRRTCGRRSCSTARGRWPTAATRRPRSTASS